MTKAIPVPRRPKYAKQIRAMKVRGYLYIPDASPASIKTIASRVGKASKPVREYTTQSEPNGVSVWREA